MMTIMYYMTLSIWRVNKTTHNKVAFIVFAAINALYCSSWDLVMDWSLMDPYARRWPFLRNVLGYKQIWIYYVAIVLDPILRFNWIFYAIYAEDVQHGAVLAFFVAFSEICRRGMWMVFRVENEHCTNVGRFRASRDVPLPYELDDTPRLSPEQHVPSAQPSLERPSTAPSQTSGADVEQGLESDNTSLRRRRAPRNGRTPLMRGLTTVGTILHMAHAQDFERKRKPEVGPDGEDDGSSDDEDADGDGDRRKAEDIDDAEIDAQLGIAKGLVEYQREQDGEGNVAASGSART